MGWRIGVDTGGTFTDVCLYDEATRKIVVTKVSSTPQDPSQAILQGVGGIVGDLVGAGAAEGLGQVTYFAHGTTVATNALLQERGVKTGLVTTKGFGDLLELGRQRRPRLYDFTATKPSALVSRDLRLEVSERVDYTGAPREALDPDEVRRAARRLKQAGVGAVAVCFLYSYLAPDHEKTVRSILQEELPEAFLSVSHEVLPEFREYERLSTTVINGFVGPVIRDYISRMRIRLAESGLVVDPKVTQSNGSITSLDVAERFPVRTLLSGPSTGVVGAARTCGTAGYPDIITFDMGGTSSDVALVNAGTPATATGMVLDGRPVRVPMLDIHTVGAGGGSIAWVDAGGHLKVGPQSAGADPGPACYGRGNREPTVTDANVVLGLLHQEALLGGTMPIDAGLSVIAMQRLGERLGLSATDTAQGIISVVTANMARAIRVVSVQRGYDPADYALVAFGGAGPLHAARLAGELGMTRIIIPQRPGAMSALGMLMTDLRSEYTRTAIMPLTGQNVGRIAAMINELEASAATWIAEETAGPSAGAGAEVSRTIDMRYRGQNYELAVDVPADAIDAAWVAVVAERFHAAHERRYGYRTDGAEIVLVTFRIGARIEVTKARFPGRPAPAAGPPEPVGHRRVFLPETGGETRCPVFARDALLPGQMVIGPAIIEQYDATSLVLPGQRATVTDSLILVVDPADGGYHRGHDHD